MTSITFASIKLLAEEIIIPWLVAHHLLDISTEQIIHIALFIFICLCIWGLYKDAQRLEIEKAKDSSLLNNGWLRTVDFILTILYPPKLWRFLSMLSQKNKLTEKILSEEKERVYYMKTNPYKGFSKSDLIPSNEKNEQLLSVADFSMKGKLEQILHELGMGDKHINMLCSRQLHCTRLEVPAGVDLYTYHDADNYPCLYYLVSGHVSMITESNTILRDFHGPHDYNINHLLLPASALLGRCFKNCITLKTNTDCEVIQFLFKKADFTSIPSGYIEYLRSLSLTLYRTKQSPFHHFLRKNNLSSSHKLSLHDAKTVGDLPVITRDRIDTIASQLTETITVEEVKSMIQPLVDEYITTVESDISEMKWDVKVFNKDDQFTFQRDELVFILHGEAEICSEDHDIYNKPFSLLNLLPYLLDDKQNIITINQDHTILLEFHVLHNTLVNSATMNCLLLDSLIYEFFSQYGELYYGLNYFWTEDGQKIMTEGEKCEEMIFLLNGRLRSVKFVDETPEGLRCKKNPNMKPDWRNQRWTNQQYQKPDKEPVITDYHRGSTFGFSNIVNETPADFSLYSVRHTSLLGICRSVLLTFIREDPRIISFLKDSTNQSNNENNCKYSRISIIPLNPITDYSYFISCLHRSLNVISSTNLVQPEDYLMDNDYYVTEFSDDYEMTLFAGYNMDLSKDRKLQNLWNSIIIRESDLVLFTVEINSEESQIKKVLEKTIEECSIELKNVRREVVFLYHNNKYNPNHTTNIQLNKWQTEMNQFDKSHENIDFYFSTVSNYYYPNEIPLYRIRQQLMKLNPSHFHHILINPSPFSQSADLLNNSSDIRRLARWLTHTSIGVVFSGGAARGWGHVGIVKAMNELNLPIDMCGGTSAGSLVGAAVAMFRGNYELVKEVTRRVAKLTSTSFFYVLDFTLPILSLTSGTFMNEVTMDAYSNKLVENTFLPFFAVSTDVTDVSEFILKSGCLWRYVRASMTVIGLVPPMPDRDMSDHLLVDGGYVNNVPTHTMKVMFDPGVLFTSSVQKLDPPLTQKIGDRVSGLQLIGELLNPFCTEPVLTQSSVNTQVMCASSVMQAEATVFEDSDLVIRPSINDVGSAAFQQFDDTEEIGYEEAIIRFREWIQGIDRKSPLYRALFETPDMSD